MSGDFAGAIINALHLILGFGAAAAAVIALGAGKGGRWHRRAGWVFFAGMTVAAVTAWMFMIARPLPLAMIQATTALYALGTAILAINPQWRAARTGEIVFLGLILVVLAGIAITGMRLTQSGGQVPPGPIAFGLIIAYFAALDVRFLFLTKPTPASRVRRHALRMALACSETVRAPLLTFADELGLPFPAIVFGTFLLVPLIYFAFAQRAVPARQA